MQYAPYTHTHPDSSDRLRRSHDSVPLRLLQVGVLLRVLRGYSVATVTGVPAAAANPQGYSNCSSLSGTTSYETCIAGQEESGCVL